MTNLNDKWTEEDYDKYFDEMNLNKRERVKNNSRSRNQKDREALEIGISAKSVRKCKKLSMKFVIVKDLQQDKSQKADMKD